MSISFSSNNTNLFLVIIFFSTLSSLIFAIRSSSQPDIIFSYSHGTYYYPPHPGEPTITMPSAFLFIAPLFTFILGSIVSLNRSRYAFYTPLLLAILFLILAIPTAYAYYLSHFTSPSTIITSLLTFSLSAFMFYRFWQHFHP